MFRVILHHLSGLLFYLQLLVALKTNDAAHVSHGEYVFANNIIMCAQAHFYTHIYDFGTLSCVLSAQ